MKHPRYPSTRDAALKTGKRFYMPDDQAIPGRGCPRHGIYAVVATHENGDPEWGNQALKHTKTGIWSCCSGPDASRAFGDAVGRGEPTTADEAISRGLDYFWDALRMDKCGHPGKMTLKRGCYTCRELHRAKHSPRQVAIQAGEKWYTPDPAKPCPAGHKARRRVYDGACEHCVSAGSDERRQIRELHPDMIVDRESARKFGFTAYRTGKPCRKGHTGWRYVSSGACIDCKEG